MIHKDGTPRILLSENEIFLNESGKVILMHGTDQDINERKRTEEELKKALETLRYSEDQFRVLVQNVKSGIALIDETGRFAVVNPVFMQMFGLDDELDILNVNSQDWSRWEVYGEDLKLLHVDDHPVRKAVITGKPVKSQPIAVRNPGANELTWMLVTAEPVMKENGQIYRIICTYQDITERKRVEEALKKAHDTLEEKVKERTAELEKAYNSLRESEKGLTEAQKIAHMGSWDWNLVTGEVYWSDELYRIFGFSPQEFKAAYEVFLDYIHPEDREYVNNAVEQALNGKPFNIDFRIISADRAEHIVHEQGEVIFNKKNVPVRLKGTIQDVTESRLAQQKIKQSEERYRSFIENFKGIAFQADENFILVFLHGTVEEITGYSEEEFMLKQPWKDIIHPEDLPRIYKEEEKIRNSQYNAYGEIDFRITRRDGKVKWVHEIYQKIPGDNRSPDKYQGAIYDITERKEAEETLAKIEKIRIKEIHHRIKNNLQVISSLLDLQTEKFSSLNVCRVSDVIQAFMESQNRVISMALIHEELYKGDNIDTLDFAAYLRTLTGDLFHSYYLGDKDISLKLNLDQVELGIDTAIPLGIIVNELISNSFRHAFPARRKGEIAVNLNRTENLIPKNEISGLNKDSRDFKERNRFDFVLNVSDNGKGIPEELDLENIDSLGLQLVNILVEQIDGHIVLNRNQGTDFTIWFNNIVDT